MLLREESNRVNANGRPALEDERLRRAASKRLRSCLCFVSYATAVCSSSTAFAQYANLGCKWTDKSVEVLFSPGTIASNGFSTSAFRTELKDAIAVWREEGQGQYEFFYEADTTELDAVAGKVNVMHRNTWSCMDNTSAKAFWGASGSSCDSQTMLVRVIMQDSCNPGTPRQWVTGWPGASWDPWGLTGNTQYETVLVHELGHMHGFPDAPGSPGVMTGAVRQAQYYYLYNADVLSVQAQAGVTTRVPRTSQSSDGTSWSSVVDISSNTTTTMPSLDGHTPSGGVGLTAGFLRASNLTAALRKGTHGGGNWSVLSNTTSSGEVEKWPVLANSAWGETLFVFPDGCDNVNVCDLDWAWTNDGGANWTEGVLVIETFGRPALDYDPNADRFVLAYLDADDSRVKTRSTPAATAPGWSAETSTIAVPYRHLGGMAFKTNGSGILLASANNAADKDFIAQFAISSGGGANYTLANAAWIMSSGVPQTSRPFGVEIDYETSPYRLVVTWGDLVNQTGMFCQKNGTSTSTFCGTAGVFGADAKNGVSVAYDRNTNKFVAGWSVP